MNWCSTLRYSYYCLLFHLVSSLPCLLLFICLWLYCTVDNITPVISYVQDCPCVICGNLLTSLEERVSWLVLHRLSALRLGVTWLNFTNISDIYSIVFRLVFDTWQKLCSCRVYSRVVHQTDETKGQAGSDAGLCREFLVWHVLE